MLVKIKFNVPVAILTVEGKKENLPPGIYERDEKVIDHWFIQGLIANGGAVIVKDEVPKPRKSTVPVANILSNLVTEVKKAKTKPVVMEVKKTEAKPVVLKEINPVVLVKPIVQIETEVEDVETIIAKNKKLVEQEPEKVAAPLKRRKRR